MQKAIQKDLCKCVADEARKPLSYQQEGQRVVRT